MAFGADLSPQASENPSADSWTAQRIASANESRKLAEEARAEAERLRNGGRS